MRCLLLSVGLLAMAWTACSGPAPQSGNAAGSGTASGAGNKADNEAASAASSAASNGAVSSAASAAPSQDTMPPTPSTNPATREVATFGGGCFWCTEAVLERLDGVSDVTSGYAGGTVDSPTYQQVCSGTTGHAEVVQVTFDPSKIGYSALLDWFFKSHDPTTLNRQGPDEGTQYRSVIFHHSEAQRTAALAAIEKAQARFADQIVTEVSPAPRFWPAEEDHQDYFRRNPTQGYCRVMIAPKIEKLGLPKR